MTGTCTACKEHCEVVVVDFGIGPFEFWGATGVDSRPDVVSNCCEAPVLDEAGDRITMRDLYECNFEPPMSEED